MSFTRRDAFIDRVETAFRTHPIVAILGPRQCGKTTLAQMYVEEQIFSKSTNFFDLENPYDLRALQEPMMALEPLEGLIVLDEIQRVPELFPLLRVLADQKKKRRFLILGSASRELIRQSSESLAGRIAYIELTPFSLFEVGHPKDLWLRGGFPPSYFARSLQDSLTWRQNYITTFLEKDIPNLGIKIAPTALRRFWMMLAHYHGQTFNSTELAKSLGISDTTARHYLDILTGTFMVRQLLPWLENIKKRQVKTPKIYFRDSGVYHSLSEITDQKSLLRHPKLGASWEGFALEEIIRHYQVLSEECFYWGVHGQAELDLFLRINGKRIGFEFKYADAPSMTKSMHASLETLRLDAIYVIYPGKKEYPLTEKIRVCPLEALPVL